MKRIDRLLWEETYLRELEKLKSRAATKCAVTRRANPTDGCRAQNVNPTTVITTGAPPAMLPASRHVFAPALGVMTKGCGNDKWTVVFGATTDCGPLKTRSH